MNLEMDLVSALAHILELIIVFQFFSELFNGKGKKLSQRQWGSFLCRSVCGIFAF